LGSRIKKDIAGGITSKKTAELIVTAARQLLIDKGCAEFSMRNVAGEANLSLSTLQQHFVTRDDLVLALFRDANARYRLAYAAMLDKAPSDRLRRFEAVLEFNFVDLAQSDTRRFFMQLWALLSSMDGATGTLLNDLYQIDLQHLSERIGELVPEVGTGEVRRRATLLAALMEGLMVVRGAHSTSSAEIKRLISAAKRAGLAIARGEASRDSDN
jgi:AcrR family transcriptional regulator